MMITAPVYNRIKSLFVALVLVLFLLLDKTIIVSGYRAHCFPAAPTSLLAQKFDPSDIITISAMKPLGLSLVENRENSKEGVCVDAINDGSVKATGSIYRGLYLLTVNGNDVRYEDFDTVLDMIIKAPDNHPVQLQFIDRRKVMAGPALLKVKSMNGNTVPITTSKGQKLRNVLLENGIEVYKANAKWSNCGGAGTCGTCAVRVTDNNFWEKRPDFERLRLKKYDEKARLSCNTIIEGDCTVEVGPPVT